MLVERMGQDSMENSVQTSEVLNPLTSTMKSHVYLLSHCNGKRFKVGKANDIVQRARHFGLRDIDWASSIGLEMLSVRAALRLERILLRTFEDWQLSAAEVMKDEGVLDGATEWMRSDCRPRMDDFLQHVKDIHPHVRIFGDSLHRQVTDLITPSLQVVAERERRRTEKLQRKETRAIVRRAEATASMAILQTALQQAKENLWGELEHHIAAGTIVGMASEGHGWNLILLGQSMEDQIWRMTMVDTQFAWPGGGGSLVTSISEYQHEDVRVCVVGLSSCFYDTWLPKKVATTAFADIAEFLRSLLPVDLGQFKATFESSIWDDSWSRESSEGLRAFGDEHLPVQQTRKAARTSAPLF